jgi:hypothetical protein
VVSHVAERRVRELIGGTARTYLARPEEQKQARPPCGDDFLYDVKGGSLRSPPPPAAGGRKRPS